MFQMKRVDTQLLSQLKPLIVCFRFFGIEINPVARLTKKHKYLTRVTEIVVFFLHVFVNILYTSLSLQPLFEQKVKDESILTLSATSGSVLWNFLIDFCSFNILSIGVHAAILKLVHLNEWKLLWKNLKHMAKENNRRSKTFHIVCRRAVMSAIVLLFLVSIDIHYI